MNGCMFVGRSPWSLKSLIDLQLVRKPEQETKSENWTVSQQRLHAITLPWRSKHFPIKLDIHSNKQMPVTWLYKFKQSIHSSRDALKAGPIWWEAFQSTDVSLQKLSAFQFDRNSCNQILQIQVCLSYQKATSRIHIRRQPTSTSSIMHSISIVTDNRNNIIQYAHVVYSIYV